jgi:hypothetical protein
MTLASCGRVLAGCLLVVLVVLALPDAATPQSRAAEAPPNIVLIFPDNIGVGEVGVYGGNRGVPTPRLDSLARDGVRLTKRRAPRHVDCLSRDQGHWCAPATAQARVPGALDVARF